MKIKISYEYDPSYDRYFAKTTVAGVAGVAGYTLLRGGESFEEARKNLIKALNDIIYNRQTQRASEEVEI